MSFANDVDDNGCNDDGDDFVNEAQFSFARFSFCTQVAVSRFSSNYPLPCQRIFKPRWIGSLHFIDAAPHGIRMKHCQRHNGPKTLSTLTQAVMKQL